MIYKVARVRIMLSLVLLLAVAFPSFAQSTSDSQKDQKQKTEKKSTKKNGDVDNIGNRNINKGSINFISLEKEIAMGRQMAAEIERRRCRARREWSVMRWRRGRCWRRRCRAGLPMRW